MTISLASAWHPRGELARFLKHLPELSSIYAGVVISLPPEAPSQLVLALESQNVCVAITRDWSHGRHRAIAQALKTNAAFIHYCDMDRLLHWVETRPDEWRGIIAKSQTIDCLIVGRTDRAYQTHPRALVQTEAISNAVASYLLGRPIDISAGSKSFSRRAAEYLIQRSKPGFALGMDSEWPLLLQRAGFQVEYAQVEGLDWESADHYAEAAADRDAQRRAADAYDADPKHWARRVEIALEIVERALAAAHEPRRANVSQ